MSDELSRARVTEAFEVIGWQLAFETEGWYCYMSRINPVQKVIVDMRKGSIAPGRLLASVLPNVDESTLQRFWEEVTRT